MSNLKERWNAPKPEFWVRVQKIGIAIGSLGLIMVAQPIGFVIAGTYLVTAGSIIGILSQLTIKDTENGNK